MSDELILGKVERIGISGNELCGNNKIYSKESDTSKSTSNEELFYTKAQQYWATIPPTVDGMLGGFGIIHTIDIQGSQNFLSEIFKLKKSLGKSQALDCGSGIGRVTKHLLMPLFHQVDMVEQDSNFTKVAIKYVGSTVYKLGRIHNCGLQEFTPESDKYDLIWCQWVLTHLTDKDLISFLKRLKLGLRKNGVFILKENITSSNNIEFDEVDSSVTRPLISYKRILKNSGYRIIRTVQQTNLPKDLFEVYMVASIPITK